MISMRLKFQESIEQVIENADIILYVLDARFIAETRNPKIEANIKDRGKKIIYVINKADLAGHINQNELNQLPFNVLVSCDTRRGVNELRTKIKILSKQVKREQIFIGVIGYPNTGKSSVINLVLGRKEIAKTSSESGFTKGVQKLKIAENVYFLDSPGIIPEDERFGSLLKLAQIGVKTYDKVDDPGLIVYELMKKYPGVFEKFYRIDAKGDSEKLIQEFGRKKGFLLKRYGVDEDRTARAILKDWQKGHIKP